MMVSMWVMERSTVAIDEKLGFGYDDRFAVFIDCNCLSTDRPGGPQEDAPMTFHGHFIMNVNPFTVLKHQAVDNALGFTIDVFGPVPLRRILQQMK